MDEAYPADEGWLCIKEFDFGFGWDGSSSGAKSDAIAKKISSGKPISAQDAQEIVKAKSEDKAPKPKKKDQALTAHPFTFARTPGPASIALLKKLRAGGDPIPKAEIIVCRAAAEDSLTAPKDSKIPFLQLTLEKVQLIDCKVTISKEQAPTENIEFKFGKAKMETIWTDNATGERTTGGALSVVFDFEETTGHVSWAEGEAGDF
jgi:type VI protein secretion system component Hcp